MGSSHKWLLPSGLAFCRLDDQQQWWNYDPPKRYVQVLLPRTADVTLFVDRVFADVLKLRTWRRHHVVSLQENGKGNWRKERHKGEGPEGKPMRGQRQGRDNASASQETNGASRR